MTGKGGPWVYDDGGRAQAGFTGSASDCFARAVSIASQQPYLEVYRFINEVAKAMKRGDIDVQRVLKRKRAWGSMGDARRGVKNPLFHEVMSRMGWKWTASMRYGQGCKVHLCASELPAGRIICRVSKHMVAVIDGIVHDTFDCSRAGTRCVYGYFSKTKGDDLVESVKSSCIPVGAPGLPSLHFPEKVVTMQRLQLKSDLDVLSSINSTCGAYAVHANCALQSRCKDVDPVTELISVFSDDDSDDDARTRRKKRRR